MNFLDPKHLIDTFGLAGLLVVIFIESGIFPAPLPGDSLLFTAGLFAADHNKYHMHIVADRARCGRRAPIAGAQLGYEIGERYGTKLFKPGRPVLQARVRATGARVRRSARARRR